MAGKTLRQKAYHEMKEFWVALYLWLIFGLLTLHSEVILAEHHIDFAAHGIALFNALALGKVVLIARDLGFADRSPDEPLIYPTLVKSAAFAVVLAVFKIIEDAAIGMYHGKTFQESITAIGGGTLKGILSMTVLVGVMLIPFFGYSELARVYGRRTMAQLFFRPRHLCNLPKGYTDSSSSHFLPTDLNPGRAKGEQNE